MTRLARSAPGEPRRAAGDDAQVGARIDRNLAGVDAEDGLASLEIRVADRDLTVEPSRPQQRRIEDVRTVGGGNHHDAAVRLEAVHLDQQLVERLLALFVAERAAAAAAADGVELVDEHDARGMAAGIAEEAADARRAHAGVHLDEVRPAGKEERDPGFAGDRSRQERLARSRGADEQHALRDPPADGRKAARFLQEVDDLFDFVLGFVDARDVLERDDVIALLGNPRASGDGRNAPGRGPIDGKGEEPEKRRDGGRGAPAERARFGRGDHVDANVPAVEIGDERSVSGQKLGRSDRLRHAAVAQVHGDDGVREGHLGDLAGVDGFEKIREDQGRRRRGPGQEICATDDTQQECGGDEHDTRSPEMREIQQEVPFRKAIRARRRHASHRWPHN